MPEIVTLEEAKEFCRVLSDDEDATFAILIAAATAAVVNVADGWDGVGEPGPRLMLAVLARVAEAYDNREQVPAARNEISLISPFRALDL